jgi:hypothetical protein
VRGWRRLCFAVAVVAVALGTAAYVHGLRARTGTFHTEGQQGAIGNLFVADTHRPAWATPASLAIAIGGITFAVAIPRRTR